MKSCFVELFEYNRLKIVENNNIESKFEISLQYVNDNVYSFENTVIVFRRLLFTNRRFIRANESNYRNRFAFFNHYIDTF